MSNRITSNTNQDLEISNKKVVVNQSSVKVEDDQLQLSQSPNTVKR